MSPDLGRLAAFDYGTRTREAHELMAAHYGTEAQPAIVGRPDVVPRLIRTIVAQNTSKPNQQRALDALWRRFPDAALIAEANVVDVIDALYVAGLANRKGPLLQAMIRELLEATDGTLDLSFLYDMPVDEARSFLMALPGIGPLSASLVLLFGMGRAVLPVNTGLHRVAQRVGMIPPTIGAERAHDLLQAALPDETIYSFHINAVTLARDFCHAARPRCAPCPLAPICAFAHGGATVARER